MNKPTPYETRWKNRTYYWKRFWARLTNTLSLVPYYKPVPKRYLVQCPAGHTNSFKSAYTSNYINDDDLYGKDYKKICSECGSKFKFNKAALDTFDHRLQLHITG